ncbi:MAG: hypothetical protein RIS47_110 [Bacteroidota bacterium]
MKDLLKVITQKIELLENGPVVADMQRNGLVYETNWGVSVVHLREMAKSLPKSLELAQLFWDENWRETRILATLAVDANEVPSPVLSAWIRDCGTIEMAEQLAFNLLKFRTFDVAFYANLLQRSESLEQVVALYAVGHLAAIGSDRLELFETVKVMVSMLLPSANALNVRALAFALRKSARMSAKDREVVLSALNFYQNSGTKFSKIVEADVMAELMDPSVIALLK